MQKITISDMTKLLIRLFVPDADNTKNEKTRLAYSTMSSIAGMLCNLFLFLLKFFIGTSMHAISIVSDGFNNLSDCLSCIITLFGYKLSAKPADREHPFGHGRMEYIISFIISIIIFIFSWQLLQDSVEKIFHPEKVSFSLVMFLILSASILVKLWMASFYRQIGRRIDSLALEAESRDSRNDVLATIISLCALIMDAFTTTSFPFDGIAGIILSLFVFASGFSIAREIINHLLGTPASSELTSAIRRLLLSHPEILGVHDMIIHDYGPGVQIGSAHVEMDSRMDFVKAHDVIDAAEEEIEQKLHVMMTIHMDPVVLGDEETDRYRMRTEEIISEIDPGLSIHDFRMIKGSRYHLVFHVLVPFRCRKTNEEIKKQIEKAFASDPHHIEFTIHFDHGYIEEE